MMSESGDGDVFKTQLKDVNATADACPPSTCDGQVGIVAKRPEADAGSGARSSK